MTFNERNEAIREKSDQATAEIRSIVENATLEPAEKTLQRVVWDERRAVAHRELLDLLREISEAVELDEAVPGGAA